MRLTVLMVGLLASWSLPGMAATLRCGSGLVSEGQSTLEVQRVCGEPGQRQRTEPAQTANGQLRQGAVTVEEWVYGPQNGLYRHLKFVDGKLVQITGRRQ
jgi:hypothetical protein